MSRSFNIDIKDFLSVVKKFDLKKFPTQGSLPGYTSCCLDGVVYYYELATKNDYKFCVYENPDCCKEKNKENIVFLKFIQEFEKLLPTLENCWPECRILNK